MLDSVLLTALACTAAVCIAGSLYRIYLHPLRNVPGPLSHAVSRLPYIRATLTGSLPYHLHQLHQKFGPVVRTAPNEVSFIGDEACNVIYARKDANGHAFPKNYDSWSETSNYFTHSLFVAGQDTYARIRKCLGTAFSERALLDHESTIASNVDRFIDQIKNDVSMSSNDVPCARTDLNERFQWLAFDVAAQSVFGENFNCLGSATYRPWLHKLSETWIFISYISSLKQLVFIATRLLNSVGMLQSRVDILAPLDAKTDKLIDAEPKTSTILSIARSHMNDKDRKQLPHFLSRIEVIANAALFPVAGTDTTATVLTAGLYLLLRHPQALEHVLEEVKSIEEEANITFRRVRQMPYLNAAIFEAMRIYPAVPEGLPRIVPRPGQEISGYWLPAGTAVQISSYAAYRSPINFEEADSFVPERWISASSRKLRDNGTGVFRPFSTGPRSCIGQNFAMAEIRMTLVKLLWHFGITLESEEDWLEQRCFLLWKRKPLVVRLISRKR